MVDGARANEHPGFGMASWVALHDIQVDVSMGRVLLCTSQEVHRRSIKKSLKVVTEGVQGTVIGLLKKLPMKSFRTPSQLLNHD
jgi:hypothetical protein